jgi:hypothetical protein
MKKEMADENIFALPRDLSSQIMDRVAEKCRNNPDFKQEFINCPNEIFKEESLALQKGIR